MSPDRERLVIEHRHLVDVLAWKFARRVRVDRDDLVSDGNLGLVIAARDWNPEKAPFVQYAWIRIEGHIRDGMRSRDPLKRVDRRQQTQITRARDQFCLREQRFPTHVELASELEITSRELSEWQKFCMNALPACLDKIIEMDNERDGEPEHTIVVDERDDFYAAECRADLESFLSKLTLRERRQVEFRYSGDFTFKEVGARFGYSESRACQIETTALKKIASVSA